MSQPILYGAPLSPFVRKVAIVLEEKQIAFEWKMVRPHDRDPEFQKLSPLGKIPAFRDDKVGLADSSVISFYLEKSYPGISLYPAETLDLVRALWFEEYFDGALIGPMGTIYVQRFMNPSLFNKPTDEALVKEAMEVKLPPMLAYLESQMVPGQWIAGKDFSIGDISLGLGYVNLRFVDYRLDEKQYPKLVDYITRIESRPSFKKCAQIAQDFMTNLKQQRK